MNSVEGFKCVECGREHRIGETEYVCASCGGNLDLVYDYGRVRAQLTRASLAGDRNFTMWRYRALLPIDSPPVSLRLSAKRGIVTRLDAAPRVRIENRL